MPPGEEDRALDSKQEGYLEALPLLHHLPTTYLCWQTDMHVNFYSYSEQTMWWRDEHRTNTDTTWTWFPKVGLFYATVPRHTCCGPEQNWAL